MIGETGMPDAASSRKPATTTGTCVAPTPEISTRNCAAAGPAASAPKAPQAPITRLLEIMPGMDLEARNWFTRNAICVCLRTDGSQAL